MRKEKQLKLKREVCAAWDQIIHGLPPDLNLYLFNLSIKWYFFNTASTMHNSVYY
jgi:hypothetical protein